MTNKRTSRWGLAALGVSGLLAGSFCLGQLLASHTAPQAAATPEHTYQVRSVAPSTETPKLTAELLSAHGKGGSPLPQITAEDLEDPIKRAEIDRRLGGATQHSVTGDAQKAFEAQSVDATFAAPLERQLRELFDDPELAQAELTEVECRSTMCRIEIAFDSKDTFREVMRVSSARGPLVGASGISDIEEHRVVAYVTPDPARHPG